MADFVWNAISPLSKALVPGHHGQSGKTGVKLTELRSATFVQVLARRGQAEAVSDAARTLFGIKAPSTPKVVTNEGASLIWCGADQFLAYVRDGDPVQQYERIEQGFLGKASLSDQSHGRCLIRISGSEVKSFLAKVISLDLHDSAFPVGTAGNTLIDHTAVNLWRVENDADGSPVYILAVFATFADSLWHTFIDSAVEFGVDVNTEN